MLFSWLISSPGFPLITLWSRASHRRPAKRTEDLLCWLSETMSCFRSWRDSWQCWHLTQVSPRFCQRQVSPRSDFVPRHSPSVASVPPCWDALSQHRQREGTIFLPRSSGHAPHLDPTLRTLIQSLLTSRASSTPLFLALHFQNHLVHLEHWKMFSKSQ